MPLGGVAVILCGPLMGVPRTVAGEHGRLFVCGGGPAMCPACGVMLFGGRLMCAPGASTRIVGALLRLYDGGHARRQAPGQFFAACAQFLGPRAGQLPAVNRGVVTCAGSRSGRHQTSLEPRDNDTAGGQDIPVYRLRRAVCGLSP